MILQVAVGVVWLDGQVLIAKRSVNVDQGGLWEFPGGKIEANETVSQALSRELSEEVGIHVVKCEPLIDIGHTYPTKQVQLHVWNVIVFTGEAKGQEGQLIKWVLPSDLKNYQFPEANQLIIDSISDL